MQQASDYEPTEPTTQDSVIHRVVDAIAAFSGSIAFLNINATVFVLWIAWNTLAPDMWRFDKYPFSALTTGVSLEAILLSILVLLSQNRASERDKAHDASEKERDRQHEQAERDRQNAQMQEEINLNRQEEEENVSILARVGSVEEKLDRLVQLMEASQPVKKYRIVGVEKK